MEDFTVDRKKIVWLTALAGVLALVCAKRNRGPHRGRHLRGPQGHRNGSSRGFRGIRRGETKLYDCRQRREYVVRQRCFSIRVEESVRRRHSDGGHLLSRQRSERTPKSGAHDPAKLG